ncbi:hypothetical protein QCE47_28620 [Caballeronia sp. LZ025]|uniref:hypothetical protein n=1 Tax=Caballeronia TaxID=1827195 RepID=UPI001FD0613C|nr:MULTISPECIES: hypothetical protein [Caballeronia]MDR5736264.1 hypothetical protein [Caballeronia sp. LZ025]
MTAGKTSQIMHAPAVSRMLNGSESEELIDVAKRAFLDFGFTHLENCNKRSRRRP